MAGVGETALIVVLLGVAALVAMGGFLTVRTIRVARHWRSRVVAALPWAPVRPVSELATAAFRTSLSARALIGTGPARQLLWLRRDLCTHLATAEGAVRQAVATGAPIGELPALLGNLRELGDRQDQELALAARGALVTDLDSVRAETSRITALADQVTRAVVEVSHSEGSIHSSYLYSALEHETAAVTAAAARLRTFGGGRG